MLLSALHCSNFKIQALGERKEQKKMKPHEEKEKKKKCEVQHPDIS